VIYDKILHSGKPSRKGGEARRLDGIAQTKLGARALRLRKISF
jgi:hypothetical protein